MTASEKLVEFVANLTPAEIEKLSAHLDTLKQIANTPEYTAQVIAGFTARLTSVWT